ncbi:hypothetical protein [Streptomyces shenzhenensis]|uniref:hypothetical protein n=1 Tax=Streptomyces shenzhenensis TaxID=943815 RepID=UPI00369D5800
MTTRTPGEIARRRAIADAAGGFPARATVVLYACVAPDQNRQDVISRLRRHAAARDWVIVGEAVDDTPADTPLQDRPGWGDVKMLITSGQAGGLVITCAAACPGAPGFPSLGEWLVNNQAFLSELAPASAAPEEAVR